MQVDHKERQHALLSASGASRWINCTPSVRMEERLGLKDESSVYAEEGTLAHEIADLQLRLQSFIGDLNLKEKWKKDIKALESHPLYESEMDGYVEIYTDYVLESYYTAKKSNPDAVLVIEEKTDFSYLVPEGFGTSDANIISDGTLEVIDLKYGKGIKVEAVGNAQMRLYALGLLRKFQLLYDIYKVKMTIVQPRLHHIDSEVISVGDLITWSEEVVKPAALAAFNGEGEPTPGSWCQWCKAKATCRGLTDYALDLAKHEFADPKTLSDAEVLAAYEKSVLLTDWANAVSKYILSTALEGKNWKGYKLVEGRSNRKIADETTALEVLQGEGFKIEQITNTKIKGIGDLEKLVGKQTFETLRLTVKPPGSPTIAPESDKRPAMGVEQAKKDFS